MISTDALSAEIEIIFEVFAFYYIYLNTIYDFAIFTTVCPESTNKQRLIINKQE